MGGAGGAECRVGEYTTVVTVVTVVTGGHLVCVLVSVLLAICVGAVGASA